MNDESEEIWGTREDDPTCMQTTSSASCAAENIGSQYRLGSLMVGSPSGSGFSENATALAPFAAHRSISIAARVGSQSGAMIIGM